MYVQCNVVCSCFDYNLEFFIEYRFNIATVNIMLKIIPHQKKKGRIALVSIDLLFASKAAKITGAGKANPGSPPPPTAPIPNNNE